MQHAYSEVWPLELAGLRMSFDTTRYIRTAAPIESGLGVRADPSREHHARAGFLRLKLQLEKYLDKNTRLGGSGPNWGC